MYFVTIVVSNDLMAVKSMFYHQGFVWKCENYAYGRFAVCLLTSLGVKIRVATRIKPVIDCGIPYQRKCNEYQLCGICGR